MKLKKNLKYKTFIQLAETISLINLGYLRGEVWMSVSGGFALQQKSPNLYQSLLKTDFDADVGKFIFFFLLDFCL